MKKFSLSIEAKISHMRITVLFIITLVGMLAQLHAQKYDYISLGDIPKSSSGRDDISNRFAAMYNDAGRPETLPRNARVRRATRSEIKFRDVTLTEAGTLASVLGEKISEIDSLVVRGPVNAEDLHTMWGGSFYGGLTVLNLEHASIQGNRLPKNAFWYQSEQYTPGSDHIDCIPLRRVMLPEGLVEIGESAFAYAIDLADINFPASIREIKRRCFSDCISLCVDPLVIPEGVEEIGYMAFVSCKSLTGRVVMPTTLKRINDGAFFSAKITECNFPDGLLEIGDAAFYATRLKEAILPNSCQYLYGGDHFALNYELEKVRFPEGLTVIPVSFVDNCVKLTEFIMPNSIEVIGDRAFWQCGSLKGLYLPPNLKSIGLEGLYYCKGLRTISLPSTLETLGAESCENWKSIEGIYCAAETPPVCIDSDVNPGWTPFGMYGDDFINRTPQDTPVYVPVGSAELYRNAWGWNYFTNFIEMDFSGIQDCPMDEGDRRDEIYDMLGRKVERPIPNHLYIKNGRKYIAR